MSGAGEAARIRAVVAALLDLHRVLLEHEERDYMDRNLLAERPSDLLPIVMSHPQFAYLRTLSVLAAELDSRLDARPGDPPPHASAVDLVDYVFGNGTAALGSPFRTKLSARIEESPDVAGTYALVRRAISELVQAAKRADASAGRHADGAARQ